MMIYILKIVIGLGCFFIAYCNFLPTDLKPEFMGGGFFLLLNVFFIDLGNLAFENRKRLSLILKCRLLSITDNKIRFSISYLYRIKVNDKFLLVPNASYPYFQPVGGVYKCYPGYEKIFTELGVIEDNTLKTSGKAKNDLRVLVPAKNANKFIDWFLTGTDREISRIREFREELIKTNLLSSNVFEEIQPTLLKRIISPVHKGFKIDNHQIVIYDIINPNFSVQQLKALEILEERGDTDKVKWASNDLVEGLGFDRHIKEEKYTIGRHTKIMKDLKWFRPGN